MSLFGNRLSGGKVGSDDGVIERCRDRGDLRVEETVSKSGLRFCIRKEQIHCGLSQGWMGDQPDRQGDLSFF